MMKTLKLPFCHPVQGKARVTQTRGGRAVRLINCTSNENHEIEISLRGLSPGTWNVFFEWQQNGEQFSLSKNLVIKE